MSDIELYKEGSLVVFSEGVYSDYGHVGHFKVVKDMSLEAMKAAAAIASKTECGYSESASAKGGLINQLIREGFLEDFNVTEIYLGAYGEISKEFGVYDD